MSIHNTTWSPRRRYSAVAVFSDDLERVVLIHKLKPAWQAGKANFPGGKVEAKDWPPHLAEGPGIVKALLEELETQQDASERILAQTKEGHWTEVQTLKFEYQEAVARLKERVETAATLALNYRQVLDACPPCRVHGAGCVAHAGPRPSHSEGSSAGDSR